MEYRIILSGTVTKEYIEEVAKDWLLVDPLRFLRQAGVSTNNGFGAGSRVGFDDTFQRSGYSAFPRAGQTTPPVWGQPPPPAGGRSTFGPPAPTHPVGPANNHLRGREQCNVGEFHIAPQIRLYQLSEMGNRQVHTFVLNDREVLIVQMGGMHASWVRLKQNWEDTHFMQAAQAVGSPVDQTQWGRLERAMESGIRQLPSEAMQSLREMVKTLFTWEGFLLIAAVTALFILGGEVALLLMGAIAVYDILMKVLPLLVAFYNAATKATTDEQIEAAGQLFAQAILRGALDVVDILFAAGAYRRLLVLGGGKLSFRAVIVYLVERVQMLIKRMAQAAERLKQLAEAAKKEREERRKRRNAPPPPLAREEAYKAAEELVRTSSKNKRPVAVTAIVDKRTGKVYIGKNGRIKSPDDLDPIVRDRLPKTSQLPEGKTWSTHNCAEVDALDQAIRDGANPKDLDMHTVRISTDKSGVVKYEDFERCENCKVTTHDINTTSDPNK